jgi:hypothetical protein
MTAWFSVLAALTLSLLAGDQFLPALHYALVAHQFCPEHGTLEHLGSEARPRWDHGNRVAEATPASSADHEHCNSVAASLPRAPVAFAAVGIAVAPSQPTLAAAHSAAVFPTDVVAFAPKQSPPA